MKHRDSRFTDCYKPDTELETWLEQQRQRDIAALDDIFPAVPSDHESIKSRVPGQQDLTEGDKS